VTSIKVRFLILFLVMSLSSCITSCEDLVVSSPQINEVDVIHPAYTPQDKIRDLLQDGNIQNFEKEGYTMESVDSATGDRENETLIANLLSRLPKLEPGKKHHVLTTSFINEIGMTGCDLALPTLSHYLLKNGIYDNVPSWTSEELAEKKEKLKLSDDTVRYRIVAARGLAYVAKGKNIYHKGTSFGVPALIEALLDVQLPVRQEAVRVLKIITNYHRNFDPLKDFETMSFEQSRWKKWWAVNEEEPRVKWLLDGFNEKGFEISSFETADCIDPLVKVISEVSVSSEAGFLNENAEDVLTNLRAKTPEIRKAMTEKLVAHLSADVASVVKTCIVAIINLNEVLQVQKPGITVGSKVTHSLFYTGVNVEPSVAFIKEWWDAEKNSPKKSAEGVAPEGAEKEKTNDPSGE